MDFFFKSAYTCRSCARTSVLYAPFEIAKIVLLIGGQPLGFALCGMEVSVRVK